MVMSSRDSRIELLMTPEKMLQIFKDIQYVCLECAKGPKMIKNTRVRIKGYGDCVVQQSRHHFEKGLIWFSFIPVDTNRLISTNDKSLIESSETPLYISWEEYGNPYWSITKGWTFRKRNWQAHYSLVEVMKHLRDNPSYKFKTRN